jgi:NADH-quinone oxidoreductase subunit E
MLSADERQEIVALRARDPEHPGAASIDALLALQARRGWVSDEALEELAALLEISPHELDSVATFYNLIFRRPVGRHLILICDSISCWLTGFETLRDHLTAKLGIPLGGTTPDGRFTLLTIPCLGACDRAPALMVGGELYGPLTPETIDALLARYA